MVPAWELKSLFIDADTIIKSIDQWFSLFSADKVYNVISSLS